MFGLGMPEIIIIVLVVAVLFWEWKDYGIFSILGSKLREEFKKGKVERVTGY